MATQLSQLNMPAHTATKKRARGHSLTALRAAIEADAAAFQAVARSR